MTRLRPQRPNHWVKPWVDLLQQGRLNEQQARTEQRRTANGQSDGLSIGGRIGDLAPSGRAGVEKFPGGSLKIDRCRACATQPATPAARVLIVHKADARVSGPEGNPFGSQSRMI
jgi:hypothetical protein